MTALTAVSVCMVSVTVHHRLEAHLVALPQSARMNAASTVSAITIAVSANLDSRGPTAVPSFSVARITVLTMECAALGSATAFLAMKAKSVM